MAAGGGGDSWKYMLGGGGVIAGIGMFLEHGSGHPSPWVLGHLLAIGGLLVVFGACEAMVKSVESLGRLLGWGPFVAGTMAGLASNLPEIVMIGFIVASNPRIAFIMTALTLQVGALLFGGYCALLPRDETGMTAMPKPLVQLSTDLYACAGTMLLTVGILMVMMREFGGPHSAGLDARDLYVFGGLLLAVQVVAIRRLISRFSGEGAADDPSEDGAEEEKGSWGEVGFYGAIGAVASVFGGHAVGGFADLLVAGLAEAGYSEMVGALVLSFFACAGVIVMIVTTHMKGMYDLAIANVSGAVTQVPFVVWPIVMIMHAAFAQAGIVPTGAEGEILAIDLETTSVVLLGFPPMLILWKSIQDDGKVNIVETAAMCAVFVLTVYLLGAHG